MKRFSIMFAVLTALVVAAPVASAQDQPAPKVYSVNAGNQLLTKVYLPATYRFVTNTRSGYFLLDGARLSYTASRRSDGRWTLKVALPSDTDAESYHYLCYRLAPADTGCLHSVYFQVMDPALSRNLFVARSGDMVQVKPKLRMFSYGSMPGLGGVRLRGSAAVQEYRKGSWTEVRRLNQRDAQSPSDDRFVDLRTPTLNLRVPGHGRYRVVYRYQLTNERHVVMASGLMTRSVAGQ